LKAIDAAIIALQEVLSSDDGNRAEDQLRFIADELGFHFAFGENRRLKGAPYGNVVLSRFPIHVKRNFDITAPGHEKRGCLRTDIQVNGSMLHVLTCIWVRRCSNIASRLDVCSMTGL
jgi:endonuclease/exonuclease/phosphatase family metal-dependent hydrolase